ncbi:Ras-GEF domain-containing family member 1C [Dufourea novaeangliae]|uniref:Ras-GEF domain-containing family member 1C n=1 Tax=Dufourea novaeangliae TaxID=178035 RepID=A0A154NXY9_DUFNO|nr:Ras-GEF domain-containing family member 1C [Dufourea novaeangliae]
MQRCRVQWAVLGPDTRDPPGAHLALVIATAAAAIAYIGHPVVVSWLFAAVGDIVAADDGVISSTDDDEIVRGAGWNAAGVEGGWISQEEIGAEVCTAWVSLPQTPAGGVGGKGSGSAGSGMVNGSGADHQDIRDGAAINTEHALVYRDGNLVSGSLEALVQHMVPTEEYYPDRAYLFAFLLSARLFIKPHELLGEVCALCEHQQNLNGEGGKNHMLSDCTASSEATYMPEATVNQGKKEDDGKSCGLFQERLQRFVPRLVQLLAEWTETFPYDFRDERVMGHVRSITQKVAAVDAAARQEVSALLQNLLLRLTALERYEEGLARLATEAATEQLTQVDITELCPSATVLAQQLTHVELERLSYIGPEEFVQAFAKESPHLETSFKDMKKTRNLESYVQWFNRLSYFVATEVCKHAKKKQRVRVVEYWIETARECFNIGNFNSLMAIIAGLNMSPISRLKKTLQRCMKRQKTQRDPLFFHLETSSFCATNEPASRSGFEFPAASMPDRGTENDFLLQWSKVQLAKFSILEHQMDPSSNFSSYRSTLKAAMWRSAGATDERQRIVVPFFSLLVKDLYFLNEGCSNKLPNGHINFEKFWQLAKQVTEFIAWKQVACPFEKNPRVIAFLQASPVLTENALALASFECEPPDNNPEKERYKALK